MKTIDSNPGGLNPGGAKLRLCHLILPLLFLHFSACAQSSNETFTIGTNSQLRADHTNFFDTNIVQLTNALLKAGFSTGGGGGGPDTRPGSDVVSIWGDSLSDGGGTGGPWGNLMTNFIPSVITDINAYSGQNSSYISNQFLLSPSQWGNVTVLWAGRNDNLNVAANTNITLANLNYMATNVVDSNLIVLGILVSTNDTQATISIITNLNNSLSNIYWPRYIDVQKMLIANGNGGAEDNAYIANHWTPFSLLASTDPLHLNVTGYSLVASNVCLVISNLFYTNSVRQSSLPGMVSNMVASTNVPMLASAGLVRATSVANVPALLITNVGGSATSMQINGGDGGEWAVYEGTWAIGLSFRDQANGIIPLVLNDGGVWESNVSSTNFHAYGTNIYTNGNFSIIEHVSTTSGEMVLTPGPTSTNTLGIDVGTNLGGASGGLPLVIRTNKLDIWHVDAGGNQVQSGSLTAAQINGTGIIASTSMQSPSINNATGSFAIGGGATPSISISTASGTGNVTVSGNLVANGSSLTNIQHYQSQSMIVTTNSAGLIVISNLISPDGRNFTNVLICRAADVTNPSTATIQVTNWPTADPNLMAALQWETTNGAPTNLVVTNNAWSPNAGSISPVTNGVNYYLIGGLMGLSGSTTNVNIFLQPQLGNMGNGNNFSMIGR